MNATHTPGPWTVVGGTEIRAGVRIICSTEEYCGVARLDDNVQADAALISAAPELLGIAEWLAGYLENNGGHDYTWKDGRLLQLDIRAAIAKAKGECPMTPELFAFPTKESAEKFINAAIMRFGSSLEWMVTLDGPEYLVAVRTVNDTNH